MKWYPGWQSWEAAPAELGGWLPGGWLPASAVDSVGRAVAVADQWSGGGRCGHRLRVAQILLDAGVRDAEVLAAAVLHDVVVGGGCPLPETRRHLSAEVPRLLVWLVPATHRHLLPLAGDLWLFESLYAGWAVRHPCREPAVGDERRGPVRGPWRGTGAGFAGRGMAGGGLAGAGPVTGQRLCSGRDRPWVEGRRWTAVALVGAADDHRMADDIAGAGADPTTEAETTRPAAPGEASWV